VIDTTPMLIAKRFNGPPGSGQGGYVAGLLAKRLVCVAEVTLRLPPPLDTPMSVEADGDGLVLRHGDDLIAEAVPSSLDMDVPPPPTWDEAMSSARGRTSYTDHVVPTCYGCGPERGDSDGLCIFTGPVADRDMVAAPWVPAAGLAAADGLVSPEHLWAALDCPGGWATIEEGEAALLGRYVVEVFALPRPGDRLIVSAWPREPRDGRKLYPGSAIHTADGDLLAAGRAIWISIGKTPHP
jgi:hypothetical protein